MRTQPIGIHPALLIARRFSYEAPGLSWDLTSMARSSVKFTRTFKVGGRASQANGERRRYGNSA